MSFDALKKSFDTAGEIQWWACFIVATALVYTGAISGEIWGAIVGGSKVVEGVLSRRTQKPKGAQ